MKKFQFKLTFVQSLAIILFLLSLILRSQNLNRPPTDAHPMRQTDTACVIYHYAQRSASFLQPQTCLIRPSTNTQGLFFFEFPAYSWLAAQTQLLFNSFTFWPIRVFNLLLFSIAFWSLFYAIKRLFNQKIAFWAVFFFALAPSSIFFFGQAIHPDIFMIAMMALSLNFAGLYLKNNQNRFLTLAIIFLNLMLATRPFTALTLVPLLYLFYSSGKKSKAVLLFISSFILLGFWKTWQLRFPEADHTWQTWIFDGRSLLLQIEYLRLLIWKNLIGEVSGRIIGLISFLGILWTFKNQILKGLKKTPPKTLFIWIWLAMIPIYWIIVPWGNIAHQYYANVVIIPIILTAAIFMNLLNEKIQDRYLKLTIFGLIAALTIFNGWRTSRHFLIERISQDEQKLAQQIQDQVPTSEKVIYLSNSSLAISLAQRQGWTTEQPPADLRSTAKVIKEQFAHANYVIVPKYAQTFPEEEFEKLQPYLQQVFESEDGMIYEITNSK